MSQPTAPRRCQEPPLPDAPVPAHPVAPPPAGNAWGVGPGACRHPPRARRRGTSPQRRSICPKWVRMAGDRVSRSVAVPRRARRLPHEPWRTRDSTGLVDEMAVTPPRGDGKPHVAAGGSAATPPAVETTSAAAHDSGGAWGSPSRARRSRGPPRVRDPIRTAGTRSDPASRPAAPARFRRTDRSPPKRPGPSRSNRTRPPSPIPRIGT